MGRSGTGKSVTLKLLMGLLKPDAGQIYVNDREVAALNSRGLVEVRKTMGFLFQYSALFDSLSVAENVAFPLRRHTRMSEDEILACVRERLAEVGLEKRVGQDAARSVRRYAKTRRSGARAGAEAIHSSGGRAEQRSGPDYDAGNRQAPDGPQSGEQDDDCRGDTQCSQRAKNRRQAYRAARGTHRHAGHGRGVG